MTPIEIVCLGFGAVMLFCLSSLTASALYICKYLIDIRADVAAIRQASESAWARSAGLPDLRSPRR
jgi:hypothetical protein